MKPVNNTIKINFVDFWSSFKPNNNYLYNLLKKHFPIQLSNNPDILFYSNFGNERKKYNCTKVFFTSENVRPNYWEADFSISFDLDTYKKRNVRFPLYNLYGNANDLKNKNLSRTKQLIDRKFCNMVVSNPNGKERINFFHELSKYKKIDSGGKVLNNIGGTVKDKILFISQYKFTFAFENSCYPGYTTEKIYEPMSVNSIPIYWGNPNIDLDFNQASFINIHDYKNTKEAIEHIMFLDKNDDAYLKMLNQPWLPNNEITQFSDENELVKFFKKIIVHKHSKTIGLFKNIYTNIDIVSSKLIYRISKKK